MLFSFFRIFWRPKPKFGLGQLVAMGGNSPHRCVVIARREWSSLHQQWEYGGLTYHMMEGQLVLAGQTYGVREEDLAY